MNAEGPDNEAKMLNTYYNTDKRSIARLKALNKSNIHTKPLLVKSTMGTYFDIRNDDLKFIANVYVAANKDEDRQVFLRQSIISKDKQATVSKELNRITKRISDLDLKSAFTFVRMFTYSGTIEFFYFIDTDKLIPIFLNYGKDNKYEDDECLGHYSEDDEVAINALCKALNQKHKDI